LTLLIFHSSEMENNIAYLVLPPGHGKSWRHNSTLGLIEADSIFDCRGDKELKLLRSAARKSNNWGKYDKEWSIRILARLTPHKWIVMVPACAIGELLSPVCLGVFQLDPVEWDENLTHRGKTHVHYEYTRETQVEPTQVKDNKELDEIIKDVCSAWLK